MRAEAQRLHPKTRPDLRLIASVSFFTFSMEYSAAAFFIAVGQYCMSILGIFDAGYMISGTYGGISM